jgi:hypothetical protein
VFVVWWVASAVWWLIIRVMATYGAYKLTDAVLPDWLKDGDDDLWPDPFPDPSDYTSTFIGIAAAGVLIILLVFATGKGSK